MLNRTLSLALADAAWPVRWTIRRFRSEFEAKCRQVACDLGGDGVPTEPAPLARIL